MKSSNDGSFAHKCEASTVIDASVEDVYGALFDLRQWPRFLPHVKEVKVAYDDATYQEFTMRVASESGDLDVRSIRRCVPDSSIEFFQPEPPVYLRHHAGGWRFEQLSGGRCKVHTYHRWTLKRAEAATAFGVSAQEAEACVERVLLDHAKLALATWKRQLESRACAA